MKIILTDISEDEFETFFSFVGGYSQMGDQDEPDKRLATKIFHQLIPLAKRMYGFEFEKIMASLAGVKEMLSGMNIIIEKKYPSDLGKN
jgi:hypothetical protein